jgi:RNase H-fold protein (predicted Holliday junction resolvase)
MDPPQSPITPVLETQGAAEGIPTVRTRGRQRKPSKQPRFSTGGQWSPDNPNSSAARIAELSPPSPPPNDSIWETTGQQHDPSQWTDCIDPPRSPIILVPETQGAAERIPTVPTGGRGKSRRSHQNSSAGHKRTVDEIADTDDDDGQTTSRVRLNEETPSPHNPAADALDSDDAYLRDISSLLGTAASEADGEQNTPPTLDKRDGIVYLAIKAYQISVGLPQAPLPEYNPQPVRRVFDTMLGKPNTWSPTATTHSSATLLDGLTRHSANLWAGILANRSEAQNLKQLRTVLVSLKEKTEGMDKKQEQLAKALDEMLRGEQEFLSMLQDTEWRHRLSSSIQANEMYSRELEIKAGTTKWRLDAISKGMMVIEKLLSTAVSEETKKRGLLKGNVGRLFEVRDKACELGTEYDGHLRSIEETACN